MTAKDWNQAFTTEGFTMAFVIKLCNSFYNESECHSFCFFIQLWPALPKPLEWQWGQSSSLQIPSKGEPLPMLVWCPAELVYNEAWSLPCILQTVQNGQVNLAGQLWVLQLAKASWWDPPDHIMSWDTGQISEALSKTSGLPGQHAGLFDLSWGKESRESFPNLAWGALHLSVG